MNPASFGASMRRVSMRKGFQRPLSVQSLRTFPTLNEAHRFTQWRLKSHVGYRFAIWQNLDDTWVVGRVMNPN